MFVWKKSETYKSSRNNKFYLTDLRETKIQIKIRVYSKKFHFFVGITKLDKTLFNWSSIGFFLRVDMFPDLKPLNAGWSTTAGLLFLSNSGSALFIVCTLFKPFFEWLRIDSSRAEWPSTGIVFLGTGLGVLPDNVGFGLMRGGGGGGTPPDLGGGPITCWLNGGGCGCPVNCMINGGGGGGGFGPPVGGMFNGVVGRGFELGKLFSGFSGLLFNLNIVFCVLNKFLI